MFFITTAALDNCSLKLSRKKALVHFSFHYNSFGHVFEFFETNRLLAVSSWEVIGQYIFT